jgi:uncharacterized protein (DUF2147 family)
MANLCYFTVIIFFTKKTREIIKNLKFRFDYSYFFTNIKIIYSCLINLREVDVKSKYFFVFIILLTTALSQSLSAQDSILGRWKTIDDETNRAKSIVTIYEENGKIFGRIDTLFRLPDEDPNPTCSKCADDDPRKDKPVKGMIIIKDMKKDGNEWVDGTILDPKNGKVYDCKLWLEDGKLKVRGYLFFLYRTQTWFRVK